MRIAILGTRGIPNNYGGPEANAEFMSPIFLQMGHEVTVYSPDEHPYKESEWQGIRIRRVFNRESRLGVWGTLLYDYLCLRDAAAAGFDIILELGHVPAAIFFPIRRKSRARLVTNMDGLEWKRTKWNFLLRRFARLTEALGARYSDALIADNEAIRQYLLAKYGRDSHFIPYGAKPIDEPQRRHLALYGVQPYGYHMLIARMEPENNIEMILDGYLLSAEERPFLVVGRTTTKFGRHVEDKYRGNERVRLLGAIYDYDVLSALRAYAALYFHGHSVGGTNPSLVEAMATRTLIAAHDNPFNRTVLESNAFYFSDAPGVAALICSDTAARRAQFISANRAKVDKVYNWERVARQHIEAFNDALTRG